MGFAVRAERRRKKRALRDLLFIIFILVLLLVATFAFFSSSLGWFVNEKQPTGKGMQMETEGYGDLIVGPTVQSVQDVHVGDNAFSVTLAMPPAHTRTRFSPATHDYTGSSLTLLKYSRYATEIDADTGLATSGDVTLANVLTNTNSRYYVDYTCYVATVGKSLEGAALNAQFLNETDRSTFLGATSVDFYINDEYRDTLNLAGYNAQVNDASTRKETASLGTMSLPINTSGTPVKIMMRCYFDGALLKASGQAFIATNSIDSEELAPLSVRFVAQGGTEVAPAG